MDKKRFLISIIIPVFNSEKYIKNTFNSIKNQTIGFDNLEVIFVDDNSTDNTKNILKEFSKKYSNVNSIFLKENSGFGGFPRNVGIENASAEFLMFIDSDDIFYPDACEFLYNKIINTDLDVVSGNYVVSINGTKNKNVWHHIKLKNNELYVKNVKENRNVLIIPPAIMSKIYKKSIILENNIKFPCGVPGEDLVFSSNYFLNSENFLFIDYPIFEYIIRDDEHDKSVSYERGKKYLYGLMESYITLFYIIVRFDETFLDICLSRLNYWVTQFVDSELSILDRIELLKFSESLFSEFNNFEGLSPLPDFELIYQLVWKHKFYEASMISELIHVKKSFDELNTPEDYEKINHKMRKVRLLDRTSNENTFNVEVIKFNEELADFNIGLKIFNKFIKEYASLDIYKAIELINKWNLFDNDFYVNEYNYTFDLEPLLHYLCWGFKENKNPSIKFDSAFYRNTYETVNKTDLNPLVYFVLYGINNGEIRINKNINPNIKFINRTKINKKISNFNELGITKEKRKKQLIISLTSFPERIYDSHFTIYSLLNQSLKPDKVILWLAQNQFPNGESDIPYNILNLKKNGLSIEWCDDLKSYKKLIPSLKKYPNHIIITADDDLYYPEDWLKTLYEDYKKNPNCIISKRARVISVNSDNTLSNYENWSLSYEERAPSFLNFSTNGAGSLFPPNSLHESIFDENTFKKLCPNGDDIWIWAMSVLNKTKIKCIKDNFVELTYVNPARDVNILNEKTLYAINVLDNDNQINNVLNEFPQILKIIIDDLGDTK